jgi:N-acetylglucosamine-6-sulfatase
MPYIEDTNVPFAIRGPGIPAGVSSNHPQSHYDLAPTFLDIAGLPSSEYPTFLDGRSLLSQWQNPQGDDPETGSGAAKDIINIEFWGAAAKENNQLQGSLTNTYKTLRIVSEDLSYMFVKWCNDDVELYDTKVSFRACRHPLLFHESLLTQ